MSKKPTSIDEYLEGVDADKRKTLEQLRRTISKIVPDAEECISYGLPAFKRDGKAFAGFGASANHCAYYPMSGSTVETLADDLKNYETSKGGVRFPPNKPLPTALLRKLIKTRLAEIGSPTAKKAATKSNKEKTSPQQASADSVVATLKKMGTKAVRDAMARYAIPSDNAVGVSVGELKKLSKTLGRNHELALGLWKTGIYEARMLAAFVDEPEKVTSAQMDSWRRDFDNWAICDHCCFHLFDKTSHAWKKVHEWSRLKSEFEKRAAFALLASLALHAKKEHDEPFAESLALIESTSTDCRNFVKKAVNWALRAIGKRNAALRSAAIAVAEKLAASENSAARWNGKDALRELKRR